MTIVAWKLREFDNMHREVTLASLFTVEEIQKIKDLATALEEQAPRVGKKGEDKRVRKCKVKWLSVNEECTWVYQRLVDAIHRINSQYFNLNLYGIQTLQYTIYNAGDKSFYAKHRDVFFEVTNGLVRKLSFSIQLTDPSEYEGGELITDVGFFPTTASKVLGDVTFFLSDSVHEAKPVTKGVRHALVGWVVGPPAV